MAMFRHNQRAHAFIEVVRTGAIVTAVAATGMLPAIAIGSQGSHGQSNSGTKISIKDDFCSSVKLRDSGDKTEKACIAPSPSGHIVLNGTRLMGVYVQGGSYTYKYNWKLNGKHVSSTNTYNFIPKDLSGKPITYSLSVTVKDLRTGKVMKPHVKITVEPAKPATVINTGTTNNNTSNTTTNITAPPGTTSTSTTPTFSTPSVTVTGAPTQANQGTLIVFSATILSQGESPDTFNWSMKINGNPSTITSSNGDCQPTTSTCTITAPTVQQQSTITIYVSITDSESPAVTSNLAYASVTVNPPVIVPPPSSDATSKNAKFGYSLY